MARFSAAEVAAAAVGASVRATTAVIENYKEYCEFLYVDGRLNPVYCVQVRFVVLDEADQMLDMGFEEDMEVILQQVG